MLLGKRHLEDGQAREAGGRRLGGASLPRPHAPDMSSPHKRALRAPENLYSSIKSIPKKKKIPWWHEAIIYQIYPRSFFDKNGHGTGTLRGKYWILFRLLEKVGTAFRRVKVE